MRIEYNEVRKGKEIRQLRILDISGKKKKKPNEVKGKILVSVVVAHLSFQQVNLFPHLLRIVRYFFKEYRASVSLVYQESCSQ